MFERTLADLIRGLRATSKNDEPAFIARAVDEIRKEVRTKDMELKAAAILKLTYLDMLGYDMSWASFNVVEVMSSARQHLKAVGYLGAVQSFKEDTDVLMLTTNTLKKDISSPHPADVATALDGLSHIVTTDIGRDLSSDMISLLNHSRPRIRKRAVLAMYNVFQKYPEAIPRSMTRLREKLEDSDPGVVSATVNILCELARRNPQDYLPLAPQLFDILTKSSNNWMLIKLIKLLGSLTPHEPRLIKKLQRPLSDLIATTPAVSLLYECVRTCIIGGMLDGATPSASSLAKTCVEKLSGFLNDSDQNLKYISLLALVKIVPTHPHLVAMHQDQILESLDDQDLSIRTRALDLVSSMVTADSLKPVIQRLLSHLVPSQKLDTTQSPSAIQLLAKTVAADGPSSLNDSQAIETPKSSLSSVAIAYRLTVSQRIISLCTQYAIAPDPTKAYQDEDDFDWAWYMSVLVDLTYVAPARIGIGASISTQLLDAVVRVSEIRSRTVELMVKILGDDILLENLVINDEAGTIEDSPVAGGEMDVLCAAAWICGEFCGEISRPLELLTILIHNPTVTRLPASIQTIFLQSALKIFGNWAARLSSEWASEDDGKSNSRILIRQVEDLSTRLEELCGSVHVEVQERAAEMLQLLTFVKADLNNAQKRLVPPSSTDAIHTSQGEPSYPKSLFLIQPLHARALYPISLNAPLGRVPYPADLDLDTPIVPPSKLRSAFTFDDIEDHDEGVTQEENELPAKSKRRKGKERSTGEGASNGVTSSSRKKKRKDDQGAVIETVEENAARARRKAALLEERRNDPFYLVDHQPGRAPAHPQDDVDSIPVVKLDRLLTLDPTLDSPRSKVAYASLQSGPSTPLPAGPGSPHLSGNGAATPVSTPTSNFSSSTLLTRKPSGFEKDTFVPSEHGDDLRAGVDYNRPSDGVSAPEPIRVVRVKKKKSSKIKKATVNEVA